MRILVTGANGFVGGHLARELRRDGAVGASRSPQSDSSIDWVLPFDLADLRAARNALVGVDTVIHAAGRAHVLRETHPDPLAAFRDANVNTTRVLLDAAIDVGVRRFVLISSVSVYGDRAHGIVSEGTPAVPSTPYGHSRLEAEQIVLRAPTVTTCVLRLPMVYGPGMKGNPLRLFDLVSRGVPLPLASIVNRRDILYVGNLVAAVRRLIQVSLPSGIVLLAADSRSVSTPTLIREIAEALDCQSGLFPFPLPLLNLLATVGTRLFGPRFPLGPDALWRLMSSLELDSQNLCQTVGPPKFDRSEGLAATAAWYRKRA